MSSPLKFLSVLSLLLIAACGFTPMYGSGSTAYTPAQGLNQIEIALIPDESGVYVRNILIDHFYRDGYPASPHYDLSVTKIVESIAHLDITADSESTRRQIMVRASFSLVERESGENVLSRNVQAITSYNVLGSQFTTRVSENDAREAALADLARQIETQTVLFLKRQTD